MTYEFRMADGRICCSADSPNHLCDACKARLPAVVPTDGYATALAAKGIAPFMPGPDYHPFGQPQDGYQIALKRRDGQ